MARRPTGQYYEWKTKAGTTSYGVRFRYRGKRRFETLGSSVDGMTRNKAEQAMADLMADVRRDLWIPPDERVPDPEPRECRPSTSSRRSGSTGSCRREGATVEA